jgi:hypothetical protein
MKTKMMFAGVLLAASIVMWPKLGHAHSNA